MPLRGERFHIDLDDSDGEDDAEAQTPSLNPLSFVGDVQERSTSTPAPPKPPAPRSSHGGFPVHRKRTTESRFKRTRDHGVNDTTKSALAVPTPVVPENDRQAAGAPQGVGDFMATERRHIDEENRMRIATMSEEEIEQERRELMDSLDPSLLQRLLRRANLDEEQSNADFPGLADAQADTPTQAAPKVKKTSKKVAFAPAQESHVHEQGAAGLRNQQALDGEAHDLPDDAQAQHEGQDGVSTNDAVKPPEANIHFPRPPQPPELDPSSPSFLADLHQKYFPSLPAEPEKLEWMNSSSNENSYSSTASGLDPKDIRFNFSGALIPPKLAAEIPVTAGLHHHGDAPDAAGYTVAELAMLARSTVAAQRCIAFQTLGRILFRLGKGEFGDPGDGMQGTVGAEDTLGALARGLWSEVEKTGVIELCVAESEGNGIAGGRHVSARAYATDAVWLWQKGGGRRMKAA